MSARVPDVPQDAIFLGLRGGSEFIQVVDMNALDALPATLRCLALPQTRTPKRRLDALARFETLERLAIPPKTRDLTPIGQLTSLRKLSIYNHPLDTLAALAPLHALEGLLLEGCRIGSLDGIEQLRGLRNLVLYSDVRDVQSWQKLAALEQLECLCICTDAPVELPPMEGFSQLRYMRVTSGTIATPVEHVLRAPALQALWFDVCDRSSEKPFRQWLAAMLERSRGAALAPPATLLRAYLGNMTPQQRQALADWLQVPVVTDCHDLGRERLSGNRPGQRVHAVAETSTQDEPDDDDDDPVQARVRRALRGECLVTYAAHAQDTDGSPVDNLDDIAWSGRCRFVGNPLHVAPDGARYTSRVRENPTWLDVARLANAMLAKTRAEDHVFLEGLHKTGDDGDVAIVQFRMGS